MEFLFGQIVTIGVFIFIASIIILFLIKSTINDYRKKYHGENLTVSEVFRKYKKDFFDDIAKQYSKEHKKIFKKSLISAKLTIIALLGFITIVYQLKYDKDLYFRTFLGVSEYRWKVFVEIAIVVFFGSLTAIIMTFSRRKRMCDNIQNIIVIGLILGLFTLTQEASGFNRYISSDFKNKAGPYYEIDIVNTAILTNTSIDKVLADVERIEQGGDPFANSWSNVASFIVCVMTIKLIMNMFTAAYFGYLSGKFSPYRKEAEYIRIPFMAELAITATLNIIAPISAPYIKDGSLTPIKIIISICTSISAFSLHIMFQYNGFLECSGNDSENENDSLSEYEEVSGKEILVAHSLC